MKIPYFMNPRGCQWPPESDWGADIAAYDKVHAQILHMADMLSAGIIGQFPAKFQ